MSLDDALSELEGFGLPELEGRAVDRLRQFVEENRGLPIERDCRSKEILAVGKEDLTATLLPLCNWVMHLAAGHTGRQRDIITGGSETCVLARLCCLHDMRLSYYLLSLFGFWHHWAE